jgi:hypothetical protein
MRAKTAGDATMAGGHVAGRTRHGVLGCNASACYHSAAADGVGSAPLPLALPLLPPGRGTACVGLRVFPLGQPPRRWITGCAAAARCAAAAGWARALAARLARAASFGSAAAEQSGTQLRNFIRDESVRAINESVFAQRRSAELAAGQALIDKFKNDERDRNDDPVAHGAMTNQLKAEQLRDFEAAKIIDQEALSVARRLTTSLPAWRMTTTALGS